MIKMAIKRLGKLLVTESSEAYKVIQKQYEKLMFSEQSFQNNKDEVRYWKNQMFFVTLTIMFIIGAPLMLYGAYIFYRTGSIGLAVTEILIYIISAIFVLNKSITINIKKLFTIFVMYTFSI